MANEIRLQIGMQIRKSNMLYLEPTRTYQADMDGTKGPTPGSVTVDTAGTAIDLSELTEYGGLCRLTNEATDDVHYVTYGIYDPESGLFYPFGELLPGETFIIRLSRFLAEEHGTGSGTGTEGPTTNQFMMKANIDPIVVRVEAFDP